ncbi:MAG: CHASE2 domain-containing protein [Burkholderiaceae bacterium]
MSASKPIDRQQLFSAALAAAIGAFLAAALALNFAFVSSVEKAAADLRVAGLQQPMPQSKDIVIAAITEETVANFPYRSPIDREFLANLLLILEAKGARGVGLDVLLDSPTEPEKDQLLAETLRELKMPVWVSYTVTPSIVNEDQLDYLNAFVPEELRAAANLATDPLDGTVRWIFPGETEPGMPISFPRKAALLAGVETPNEQPLIAWRPRPDLETPVFPIYPSHAVPVMPDEWFKDKFVLVGAVLSITDRHRTPLAIYADGDDAMMPGIIVQAHALSQFLEGRKPHQVTTPATIGMAILFALIGVAIGLLKRGMFFNVLAALLLVVGLWLGAFLGFYYQWLPMLPVVAPTLALALSLWMMDVLIGRAERKQRQFVQGAFSRYVAPAVVDRLVENPDALNVSGTRQDATFIFTDIAGFTTLSESLSSEKLSEVLNAYLDGACAVVFKHAGTVDKFIGDAVMAVFNAPIPQPDHVARAVRCALELDLFCESFREKMNAEGIPIGVTRIGIHTGVATVGNFGSHARMDFTALGDTVNTASRTEGVNKYFGTRICATQEVVSQCPDLFFLPIGDIVLKGKTQAVRLFTPVSEEKSRSAFALRYEEAVHALENLGSSGNQSESDDAKQVAAIVQKLNEDFPEEPLAAFHAKRVSQGIVSLRVVMEDK